MEEFSIDDNDEDSSQKRRKLERYLGRYVKYNKTQTKENEM